MQSTSRSTIRVASTKFQLRRSQNVCRHHYCQQRFKSRSTTKPNTSEYASGTSASTSTSTSKTTKVKDPSHVPNKEKIQSFTIGTIAGLAGSLVGMGGGFIMIPLMTSTSPGLLGLSLSQHMAHGTSLFAVTSTGLAGGLSYANEGNVDLYSAAAIAVSGMLTARLGAKFSNTLSQRDLKRVLGAFMILISPIVPLKHYLMPDDEKEKGEDGSLRTSSSSSPSISGEFNWKTVGLSSCVGLFSGFTAGLMGVGGGAVVVPALNLMGMDHHTAIGTSLTAMALPAIVGTMTHYKSGNVNIRIAPFLAMGALVGSYCGGKIGVKVDEKLMRNGFSGLMLTLGVRTVLKA